MTLIEFLKEYSHNNIVRLLYETEEGHKTVLDNFNVVSMDWEIVANKGVFKDYRNNQVKSLASILIHHTNYPEAINIVIKNNSF
jgi:hypothetical protein